MSESIIRYITVTELCQQANVSRDTIVEFVEYGIIEPSGSSPNDWTFAVSVINTAQCALRLRRDLELDWEAIALALDLMQQRDRLREENELLRRRLSRFLFD